MLPTPPAESLGFVPCLCHTTLLGPHLLAGIFHSLTSTAGRELSSMKAPCDCNTCGLVSPSPSWCGSKAVQVHSPFSAHDQSLIPVSPFVSSQPFCSPSSYWVSRWTACPQILSMTWSSVKSNLALYRPRKCCPRLIGLFIPLATQGGFKIQFPIRPAS